MGSAQATLFYGNVSENFRLLEEHQNFFGRTEQKENKEDEWSQFPLSLSERKDVKCTKRYPSKAQKQGQTQMEQTCEYYAAILAKMIHMSVPCSIRGTKRKAKRLTTFTDSGNNLWIWKSWRGGYAWPDHLWCIRLQGLKESPVRESDLKRRKPIDICRATETSREQIKSISEDKAITVDVRSLRIHRKGNHKKSPPTSA